MHNKDRWIEKRPFLNETVKIEFSDWTKLGTRIGVCVGFCNLGIKIMFGDCIRILDSNTSFFVYKNI